MNLEIARKVLEAEARAIDALAERIGAPFESAVTAIRDAPGRVIVTGMGKSGLVARKIAATLASTGTPALYMHPAEAIHGDLGMLVEGDVVLALSHGGETVEILTLLETIRRLGSQIITLTGSAHSTLGREADIVLETGVTEEGSPFELAPMASTTAAMAIGDALAATLMQLRGFDEEDFARLHPGGRLGKKLARVKQMMHAGDARPMVAPDTALGDVLIEMSRKRLGCAVVVDEEERLVGIITDGDLRRLLERVPEPMKRKARDAMTSNPATTTGDILASEALRMMEDRKITMIPVIDAERRLEGVLQIHDLWGTHLF